MKRFFLFLVVTINISAFSYERMPYRDLYTIVSDTYDSTLAVGTCVVFGTATVDKPIKGGTVATTNRSSEALTDSRGNYTLVLSDKDSSLFFYHLVYGEIVIWNYDFKSQHRVRIDFYPRNESEENQMVKKPVIYLYSDTETMVELTLTHPNITFTYPQYKENWSVKTLANGSIQDLSTKKIYPYLFWEGETKNLRYQMEDGKISGQLIKTDTLINYLESSLTKMGLNQTEQTDFITFWAPSIVAKDFVFIQFLIDEDYDTNVAGLEVSPLPDSRRRIFIQFTLMDFEFVPFEFSPQEFPEFARKGFTLIEWGGSEIDFVSDVN